MCALQMQAEAGPTMLETLELLEGAIERFVTKQARRGASAGSRQAAMPASWHLALDAMAPVIALPAHLIDICCMRSCKVTGKSSGSASQGGTLVPQPVM